MQFVLKLNFTEITFFWSFLPEKKTFSRNTWLVLVLVITTAEAIGCDDMVVNFLFIVLWQVVPLGGGRGGTSL